MDPSQQASTSRQPTTAAAAAANVQVPLKLKTSIPELALPPTSYLVPTAFARSQLSTLVNRLLSQTAGHEGTIPFDFIVEGQLLRESLSSWLDRNGKTVEEGIELEYIKSTLPPKWAGAFEHDDWISSIDATRPGSFLTASYDSCLRIFSYASPQEALLTHKAASSGSSTQGLVDARWVGSSSNVVTAGLDGNVRFFAMPEADSTPATPSSTYTSQPKQLWCGTHKESSKSSSLVGPFDMKQSALTSVSVAHDGAALLSASRDGSIGYWRLADLASSAGAGDGDEEADGKRKRRKAINGKTASDADGTIKAANALLWHLPPTLLNGDSYVPAANSRISRAIFSRTSSERGFSAGYDGRIIEWDLFSATKGGNPKLSQKTSDKVILCMDQLCPEIGSSEVSLVTGHMDRSIGVWDMRSSTANISLLLPAAHLAPIYSISAHPSSSHLLASTSGDGILKLFDVRSPKRALFSLTRPASTTNRTGTANGHAATGKEKLLACQWDMGGQIVLAGGEDCRVNLFRGEGIGR